MNMKFKQTFLLILILLLGSSCIMFPLPAKHREEIDTVRKQLVVGTSTKEEVISILGEPDVTKERYILYRKKEYDGGWGVIMGNAGGQDWQEYMDLYFGFDNYGTLIEYRFDKYDAGARPIKDDEEEASRLLKIVAYEPVPHLAKRIVLEELSFYPPKGENWEISSKPFVANIFYEDFGRSLVKAKTFKKTVVGQNHVPEKAETIWAEVVRHEFVLMDFDYVDDLRGLVQSRCTYRKPDSADYRAWLNSHCKKPYELGQFVLESNILDKEFKEMDCVKENSKIQSGRRVSGSILAFIRYKQAYICVHPKNPKQVIELKAVQELPKGQTPTDIQNELDHIFNSLKIDDLP
jgi:hypothetical protein